MPLLLLDVGLCIEESLYLGSNPLLPLNNFLC